MCAFVCLFCSFYLQIEAVAHPSSSPRKYGGLNLFGSEGYVKMAQAGGHMLDDQELRKKIDEKLDGWHKKAWKRRLLAAAMAGAAAGALSGFYGGVEDASAEAGHEIEVQPRYGIGASGCG